MTSQTPESPSISPDKAQVPQQPLNLWTWLRAQVDRAGYRPRSAPGIVARRLTEDGATYYVLKNPGLGTYLKLSEEDYTLWDLMDGSRTVKDLVVSYFQRYITFAFGRIMGLVDQLRANGFLTDKPVGVYQQIKEELAARDWSHRWGGLAQAFLEHEFQVDGIDRHVTLVYRLGGRLLFTWPVLGLLTLLILAGLGGFAMLVGRENGYAILARENSTALGYVEGLVTLLLINLVMIFVHESAHALTTKHFGREVRRGGLMIYYGMPAFFVDTVDIWLEPKRRRIAVSWAGPYTELAVAGLCSLLALWIADPNNLIATLFFRAAFLGYLSVFINLNPLLELDGYFILSDWLGIPMLRQRSFAFIREELPGRIRAWLPPQVRSLIPGIQPVESAPGREPAKPLDRDEIILAVFGGLAALYTVYALWLAFYFWRTRISDVLRDLWNKDPAVVFKPLVALGVILVVVPVALALGASAWTLIRRLAGWLERRHFFEQERSIALLATIALALILLVPALVGATARQALFAAGPVLLCGLSFWTLVLTAWQYRGAEFQATFWGLALAAGVWLLGACLRGFNLALGENPLREPISDLALLAEQLAAVGLLVGGIRSLVGVDLRRGPAWEQVAMVALLAIGFVAMLPIARWTADWPLTEVLAAVASAYFTLVFLALIAPTLTAYFRTPFFIPWTALALGAGSLGVLNIDRSVPNWSPGTPGDGWLGLGVSALWAIGGLAYVTARTRLRFPGQHWSYRLTFSEETRLQSAFARFFETLFSCFRVTFGTRRAQTVDDELDIISVAADWDIEIDGGRVRDELDLSQLSILQQADRYREVLARTMDLIDDWAGVALAARMAQVAYDSLPWPERETLGRYVLAGTTWGASIADQFASALSDRARLLRGVPYFAGLTNRDFYLLQAAVEYQEEPAGRVLARPGTPVHRFVLIQSGEVEVWRRDSIDQSERLVDELRRGGSFGFEVFLEGKESHKATYRTSVDTEILTISSAEVARLRRAGVEIDSRAVGVLSTAYLLGRMPIFADLSPRQISDLAERMKQARVDAGQVIVEQGAPRQYFYVIVEGQVSVSVRDETGKETAVTHLGEGEHFGEAALYVDEPYAATYRAETPVELLTLDEPTFDSLVASSRQVARYVEQISSGRALDTRRTLLGVTRGQ